MKDDMNNNRKILIAYVDNEGWIRAMVDNEEHNRGQGYSGVDNRIQSRSEDSADGSGGEVHVQY